MNLKLRVVFSIIAIVSLALALTPGVAFAASSGSTPGSFSCGNVTPTVSAPVPGDSVITPEIPNTITIPVTDPNTLADIESITIHIYFDDDGTYVGGSYPGAVDAQHYAILEWTPDGGWTITQEGTTWAIDAANCSTPDLGSTSGSFVFSYIPGTVAEWTSDGSDISEWNIYVEVFDGTATGTSYTEDIEMAWYGAVTVLDGVYWGTVTPGMVYAEGAPSEVADISVNYVCNGAYDEQIAASGTWTGATYSATLDPTEAVDSANEFALRADDDGTLDGAVVVNTAPDNYTAIDDTGTITEEIGDTIDINSIWLKLSATFDSDTYAGTIFYQIAQGS
ncbi:MAG: hypothetical protein WC455_00630 [Dehalococcoidia bacterium]